MPCLGFVLRGIFLCRPSEIEWFLYGLKNIFPDAWDKFVAPVPPAERALLDDAQNRAADAVESLIKNGTAATMNVFNQ